MQFSSISETAPFKHVPFTSISLYLRYNLSNVLLVIMRLYDSLARLIRHVCARNFYSNDLPYREQYFETRARHNPWRRYSICINWHHYCALPIFWDKPISHLSFRITPCTLVLCFLCLEWCFLKTLFFQALKIFSIENVEILIHEYKNNNNPD